MCPRRVCLTCGEPSRRETEPSERYNAERSGVDFLGKNNRDQGLAGDRLNGRPNSEYLTTGWSTCRHPGTDGHRLDGYHTGTGWRPGIVLDPFAGTGTTLAVATGHGRDAIGIDLDPRNADLALNRVGPLLLTVEHHGEPVEYDGDGTHNSTSSNPRFREGYLKNDGRKTAQKNAYGTPA
jgi:hypothetical protein